MRKNKLLISTLLPVAAFVTVVGAGYSAWYFQGTSTASGTANITVEPVVAGGGIAVTSSSHGLTLDQNSNGLNPSGTGITWKDITLTYTADDALGGASAEGTGTISWTVTTPTNFETYVNITKSGTWTIADIYADEPITLDKDDLGLSYKAEPSNYTEWKAMNDALNGKTITVEFKVTYNYN